MIATARVRLTVCHHLIFPMLDQTLPDKPFVEALFCCIFLNGNFYERRLIGVGFFEA